jgi:hypothetical protein
MRFPPPSCSDNLPTTDRANCHAQDPNDTFINRSHRSVDSGFAWASRHPRSRACAHYGVSTGRLNEAVKRNVERFPSDFMFQLSAQEIENLRSQFATSSWGGRRYRPFAFTEDGAIQAANVLNSPRAVAMGIYVVRAFVQLRARPWLQNQHASATRPQRSSLRFLPPAKSVGIIGSGVVVGPPCSWAGQFTPRRFALLHRCVQPHVLGAQICASIPGNLQRVG